MQPRGATKGTKRARQYGRIEDGELERSASESRAEEIPRVPDKERARASPASARGPRPSPASHCTVTVVAQAKNRSART